MEFKTKTIVDITEAMEQLATEIRRYGIIEEDTQRAGGAIRDTVFNYFGEKYRVTKYKGEVKSIDKIN